MWLSRSREGETGKAEESAGAPAKGKKAAKEAQRAQRKQEDRAAEKQRSRDQLLQVLLSSSEPHDQQSARCLPLLALLCPAVSLRGLPSHHLHELMQQPQDEDQGGQAGGRGGHVCCKEGTAVLLQGCMRAD